MFEAWINGDKLCKPLCCIGKHILQARPAYIYIVVVRVERFVVCGLSLALEIASA